MYNSPKADVLLIPATSVLSEVSVGNPVDGVDGDAPARRSYSPQAQH